MLYVILAFVLTAVVLGAAALSLFVSPRRSPGHIGRRGAARGTP